MYQDAVNNIPNEHWRTGDIEHLIPARIVYHVLDCADFYSNPTPKGYVWGHRFNFDWGKASPKQLPTKDQIRAYLEEMITKVDRWLQGFTDEDFLSPEKAFAWTGKTIMGRALYLLVHCRQHILNNQDNANSDGCNRLKIRYQENILRTHQQYLM